ncbi:MAG TPA: ribosome silencing factor [Ktedonobacterales bacterium]|jgi:ribosome-associated protein|nr:ribosome silencing factor [Ktedonobacterales bacterium]
MAVVVALSDSHRGEAIHHRAARRAEGSLGLDSAEVAKIIADVAVDKKAADVVILDIRSQSVIADYFIICTGNNPRQIQAIAGAVEDKLDEIHITAKGFEGAAENGWMLLDCGDVIVHIFGPLERDFYRLERLWSAAPTVVYLQ